MGTKTGKRNKTNGYRHHHYHAIVAKFLNNALINNNTRLEASIELKVNRSKDSRTHARRNNGYSTRDIFLERHERVPSIHHDRKRHTDNAARYYRPGRGSLNNH